MSNFIIAVTPYFKRNALEEIKKVDINSNILKTFDDSLIEISSNLDEKDFLSKLQKSKPIFIKHICPANFAGKLTGELDKDKKIILDFLLNIGVVINKDERFAIQCRIVSGSTNGERLPYSSKDIEVYVGTYFTDIGGVPIFSDKNIVNESDVHIISIFINNGDFYIGDSTSGDNLNFACDEYRISSKAGGREISRAENKLKEALAKYKIDLGENGGVALDIGAAPGGWTKVLVDHGFNVVAVDPGDLHPDLQKNTKVKHYKCRIEELEFNNYFDIIVNDMNVDPQVTAQIMNSLSHCLKKGGLAIVTLKLPEKPLISIQESVKELDKQYEVIAINNLFHNRQEVTALIRKKN